MQDEGRRQLEGSGELPDGVISTTADTVRLASADYATFQGLEAFENSAVAPMSLRSQGDGGAETVGPSVKEGEMTTYTWNGVNGDWSVAADWTPNGVPGPGDTADITASGNYTVTIGLSAGSSESESAAVVNLNDAGAVLAINGSLKVGTLTNTAGTINLTGSASNQATLDVTGAAPATLGNINILGDALIEFGSGAVTSNGAGTTFSLRDDPTAISLNASGNTSGTFTNAGNLNVDNFNNGFGSFDAGGSKLTIGNTLANSGAVNIGNTGLSTATKVTATGLSNTGTINLTGGSALATLDDTGSASNSGTLDINAHAAFDLTGSTSVFKQTAGETVVTGALSAPRIAVTGGTFEGVGTVTGALNVTGGTVVGGALNSTPGTLTVSGAYKQTGNAGILQADINTGAAQKSSIIKVTGSPGTPGASGSVNLAGGTLLIDAQSSLALNTPYTVMTFGAGHLYGQFGQVQTEGALGSHTGNGNSVNLGNGQTLEVLYNEASGDVQVEPVTTPSSTTYTWDVGSGTWNASSGADWNPPGNGTTPSNTSNVTIGAGGGGTVTLAQDQTIASLSITSGYTLSGSSKSISTTGNVSLAGGATLSIDNMNVGGVFTDSGSATFAAVLTINGAGQLLLSNGSITGGMNGTGTFESVSGTTDTLSNVTIYKGTTFTASSGATTDINGTISNRGTFVIDGTSGNAIVNLTANVTLSGGGAVVMKSSKSGSAFLRGSGVTLTNSNNTIQGAGNIGDSGALAFANEATVDANVSTSGLSLNVNGGNGGVTNTGTLEATGGGVLQLFDTITNTGGAITASGTNSVVNVENATIVGGALNTASGGLMQSVSSADLNGVTISSGSTYTAGPGTTTQLDGAIVNDGTFAVNGASGNAIVTLGSAVTLLGGGTVTMSSGASGSAFLRGSGLTLTNTNDTIQGAGLMGDNAALAIDNKGTIDANSSGQSLNLGQGGGGLTNTGTFEATGGGHLFAAGALGGAGQLEIGASSEVELGGNTSENTTFLSATAAKLRIDNATTTTYSGVLNSFAKGDILELGNTNATTATPTSFNGTDTTLTVDLSSGGPLLYTLAGNLTGDTFSVTHSGSDSDIAIATTAAFEQAFSLLGNPMGSSFIGSSGVFGASGGTPGSAELNLAGSAHAHS